MIITYEVIQVYPDPLAQTTNMSRVFINQECRVNTIIYHHFFFLSEGRLRTRVCMCQRNVF
jgi:hypothetical protein